MARIAFTVPLALGTMLVAGNAATAADKVSAKSGFGGGAVVTTTMNLGGQGTAASAKAASDTELAWYHGGYYRGYRRGFYNGFYGGWGGYYPAFYPYAGFYSPAYYYPPVLGFNGGFGGISVGLYGIKGTGSDATAPAVTLNLAGPTNSVAQRASQSMSPPASLPGTYQPGAFRYDWDPANPVPQPKQDPGASNGQAAPTLPPSTGLPVSLPKTQTPPAKPYTYKGYGEK